MEGSEELTSLPKPYTVTDEEKHTPSQPREHHHLHHQQQQQLGLGFQPSLSVDPDQNLDPAPPPPPPPPDDLDQQATDEELQNQQPISEELGNLQPVNDEFRNQQTVSEECRNQQPVNAEFQNQQTASEELQNQQATDEELQNLVNQELQTQKPISEEFLNQQPVNEEFQNQQTVSGELQNINEELQNLVLKEKEKVSEKGVQHDDDIDGTQSEADEKVDREVDVEGEERNENDDAKGEEGIDDGNDDDDDDVDDDDDDDGSTTENEEDDNGNENENVGGETALVAGSKDGSCTRYNYPLKPDAEDCSYYMRTGMCKFGSNCKFNHPPKMKNQAPMEKEENPERPGQTECKYYLRSGGCKFGKACRYNHSRGKIPVAPAVEFNFLGLPIRPGERECPYYMRNGSCKYESNCRFNHPDPTAVGGGDASSGYGNGGPVSLQGASQSTISSWSPPRALNETPFVPGMFSPTQGVPSSNLEWNGYQAPVYPTPVGSLPTPPAFLNSPVDTKFYTHHKQQMLVEEFPERPGQPECSYFLKTGDCKYKSGCKFHHPKNRMPKTATLALSDKGLPLRPDQNICSHYNRYGICKFGPACKFDHPVNYGHSDSSAVSGPDKPSPFGNSATTDCGWQ